MTKILLLVLLLAAPAFATQTAHIYVTADSFVGGTLGAYGSQGPADYTPSTSISGLIVAGKWCFGTTDNETVYITTAVLPSDNTTKTLYPQLRLWGVTGTGTAKFGVTYTSRATGMIDDGNLSGVTGQNVVPFDVSILIERKMGVTINAPATAILNYATGAPCVAGTACQSAPLVIRIQRINDDNVCTGVHEPYDCCLDAGSGTCAPVSDYGAEICVEEIDNQYIVN